MLVVCETPLLNTSYYEAPRGLVDSVFLFRMASPGREGLAGPRMFARTLASARDSDISLREPESWDKGDLTPHRVLGQGGVFFPKPLNATVPLSGALPLLDSTSTRVGTPVGFGTRETWVKPVSDSTKWRSDRDPAHGETMGTLNAAVDELRYTACSETRMLEEMHGVMPFPLNCLENFEN